MDGMELLLFGRTNYTKLRKKDNGLGGRPVSQFRRGFPYNVGQEAGR
jgi:hypothetical protein